MLLRKERGAKLSSGWQEFNSHNRLICLCVAVILFSMLSVYKTFSA